MCPKCGGKLRCYFHAFQLEKQQGTIWLWCGACLTFTHLPRIQAVRTPVDPFAGLSLDQFAELETSSDEPFLDRLERMWIEGVLAPM